MKIAICDDEKHICYEIEKLILQYNGNTGRELSYDIYHTGAALLSSESDYDILLLDIELKDENGLEAAALFRERSKAKIIFITSHIEEMPNGYKVRAFRFLTKPVDRALFVEAMDSAIREISSVKRIELQSSDKTIVVYNKDIVYAEAGNHASCVRTVDGVFRCPLILEELKEQLTGLEFMSPHRSYIVNMDHIKEIGANEITLNNGERVRISRLKQKEFRRVFYQYLRGKISGHD